MRSVIRIVTLVAVGMLPLLLPGTAGATADALDQYQTVQNTWGESGDQRVGQVFTAGRYGYLDRVSVYLANYPADPHWLHIDEYPDRDQRRHRWRNLSAYRGQSLAASGRRW